MEKKDYELKTYLKIIRKRKLSVYIIVSFCIIAALIFSLVMPPYYKAEVVLYTHKGVEQIGEQSMNILFSQAPFPVLNKFLLYAQLGILRSSRLAKMVAAEITERTADQLWRNTYFKVTTKDFLFRIIAKDRDPKLVARIANTYALLSNDLLRELTLPGIRQERNYIESQLEKARGDLHEAALKLTEFKQRYSTVSLSKETERLVYDLAEQRMKIFDIQMQIFSKKPELRSSHPDMIALKAKKEASQRQLEELKDKFSQLPQIELELSQLEVDVLHFQKSLNMLIDKLDEVKMQETKPMYTFIILDPAIVPDSPCFPVLSLNLIIAAVIGLIFGIFYCFFKEYMNNNNHNNGKNGNINNIAEESKVK